MPSAIAIANLEKIERGEDESVCGTRKNLGNIGTDNNMTLYNLATVSEKEVGVLQCSSPLATPGN